MVTTLKVIQVSQIFPSAEQPRENFDKEKIKELAESILSNGLINPIVVRKEGSKFLIVAGERRWRAHKLAGLKTIDAFVKEYKNEGGWMVESLIENIQREDLHPVEKAKFLKKIMVLKKIKTYIELGKLVGISASAIRHQLDLIQDEETARLVRDGAVSSSSAQNIMAMADKKIAKRLLQKVAKKDMGRTEIRETIKIIGKATPEIKNALLDDKITFEQAEDLMKISSPKAREKALKETASHRRLADITPKQMKNAKPELTDALKKSFNSVQKIIFTHLYEAKTGIIKSNKNLKQANKMLDELLGKQFEYALNDKTISLSIRGLISISDKVSEFKLSLQRFEELKEQFVDRIENKNDNY